MTPTPGLESAEKEARQAMGNVRCRVPQPSHEHDDGGCGTCALEQRIVSALEAYAHRQVVAALEEAARATCPWCDMKMEHLSWTNMHHRGSPPPGGDLACRAHKIHDQIAARKATEGGSLDAG